MRGWYEITSKDDPRFCRTGKDFVCPVRGPLNFDYRDWLEFKAFQLGIEVPKDIRIMVFWHGEESGANV